MKIGEVIEASTLSFTSECYELHNPPPLGSLVRVEEGGTKIYGVVYHAITTSLEPGRKVIAWGKEKEAEEDIFRSQPQLVHLLRTYFGAFILAHSLGGSLFYFLPAKPPKLHSFVYLCHGDEVRGFGQCLDFLSSLVELNCAGRDEVIAACLRYLSSHQEDGRGFLIKAGKELAILLSGQTQRLNSILRRMSGG
jgi:hypothetical protein